MLTPCPFLLDNCVLKNNQIDIWQYSLNAEYSEAYSFLSASEQERANRFHFPHHQRRFQNAHYILRLILARYTDTLPHHLEFTSGKHGKPQLLNMQDLQFNLSHSGEMALLAVGKTHPLGIDVEYFSERPYFGIGEHLFSPKENQALQNATNSLTAQLFFNIWAQKEALIKACGLGLSYPTQAFDVPVLAQTPQTIVDRLHNKIWKIQTFMPEIACCAAVCFEEEIDTLRHLKLSQKHLDELRVAHSPLRK